MIKLFSPADKQFNSNGDKIITPIKALVHKQDNGDFYLELEVETSFVDYLKPRCILVAPTPQGEQGFRISKIQKNRGKISVRANHLFYDSENYVIKNKAIVEKDCDAALKELNTATDYESPFQVSSNVSTISSWFYSRSSLCSAIQTIVEKWGGHLVRDNFKIEIREAIGKDNGILVQRGKNTMDITCEENWDNVVTKLLPVGKDDILLNYFDGDQDIYVTAPVQYEIPYTKIINFSPNVSENNYKGADGVLNEYDYKQALVDDLKKQAEKYVQQNCIPKVNYTLKANINSVIDIGDTVAVVDARIGVDVITQVVSFVYNCISKKYEEIEFGNIRKRASDLIEYVASKCSNNVTSKLTTEITNKIDVVRNSTGQQVQAMGERFHNSLDTYAVQQKKHIITACLNANTNNLPRNVYTKIPLTKLTANSTNLKIVNGGIAIGRGIQWVKVSAIAQFHAPATNGQRSILIAKNVINQNNILAEVTNYLTANLPYSMEIPPKLIPVEENDVIWLIYYAADSSDIIRGNNIGNLTFLTVESIN